MFSHAIQIITDSHAWSIAALALCLLSLTLWDFKDTILPDILNVTVFILGVAVAVLDPLWVEGGWLMACFYGVVGVALSYGFRGLAEHYYKQEPMGLGDVKFLGAAGAWVGLTGLIYVVLIGAVMTLLFMVVLNLIRHQRLRLDQAVPFGPGLCLGLLVTVLYGPLVNWL